MVASESFDDIVVGAGTAGAVVAARLSEDGSRRVALVEAGPHYATREQTPADLLNGNAMSLARHGWGLSARLTADRRTALPQGKVTGGSSAIGNTVMIRATPADLDEWAALGNPAWSWDESLPRLRALEDDLDFGADPHHGTGGPIPVRRWRPEELTTVQRLFLDGCLEAGHPYAADHNHPLSTGVGPIPSNRRDARERVSTAMAYLWPAVDRPHLTVVPDALVDRVLIEDGAVRGVRILEGDTERVLTARRVVLAAGAIGSPAVLLRSGVGPAGHLAELGVPVRADLPGVGGGLVDQPRIGVFLAPRPGAADERASTGQIVLRTTAPAAAAGTGTERFNDMYYAMVNHFNLAHHFPRLRADAGTDGVFGIMAVVRRPHSRGRVTLTSADPRTAPHVDLGYLTDPRDHDLFAEAVRTCWQLANSAGIGAQAERVVALDEKAVHDEERLREYVGTTVDTAFNPAGTLRMGPADDPDAVVDQFGAVRGVTGLHVADASVMPSMVCANTALTTVLIGERIAEALREG
ncbi:GMC family oxidoreductase [Kitasatospora phosalacinea]|uniref:GMC family oxidoreductase n=1 Tax=Kitasatospora phosalacinea TaxID=2065 RepID=A0A9W6Q1S6_9ACTN|nr:GMC family oxidoreductase N-terminal domain-containing protein [Kitasatospora phosalacinea]GLW68380.1 GMC family oxidoreductase [Kitasatospora phosalacinea]